MNDVITQPAAFQAMKTDLEISMDDVVSAFVSQYENNLFAKKKELSTEIRTNEKILEELEKKVRKEVTGDEFKVPLPFSLKLVVKQGAVNYVAKTVSFEIIISDKERTHYYGNEIKLSKTKKIPAAHIKTHDKTVEVLEKLRAELAEVLVNLKSVTRKERQVRGRIAMRKLEDSGYASLMQDKELIQLVQLED